LVFVIAEIGINHNGDINIAKKLIDMAKDCNCDAVKFQKRTIEKAYSKEVLDSPRESPWGKTTREQKLGLEFEKEEFDIIDKYCKEKEIEWYASSWDIDSQIFLQQYHLKHNKVASAMLTNLPLLEIIAKEGRYTFISTGMSDFTQIRKATEIFRKYDCPFELMNSNSSYPMQLEEANLQCIETLRNEFNCDVGYSGHETVSYLCCIVAATLGATSIERHITLDRSMYGSDQSASLEYGGLDRMVKNVRQVQMVLGDGVKRIYDSEVPAMKKLRANI